MSKNEIDFKAVKNADMLKHPEKYFTGPGAHVKDRIRINESPEIPREGIFLSLNGYAYLAHAGVDIDIPRPIRLMLDTRIKTEVVHTDEKDYARDIPRITYTLVKEDIGAVGE